MYALVRWMVALDIKTQFAPICDRVMQLEEFNKTWHGHEASAQGNGKVSNVIKIKGLDCGAIEEFEDFRIQIVIFLRYNSSFTNGNRRLRSYMYEIKNFFKYIDSYEHDYSNKNDKVNDIKKYGRFDDIATMRREATAKYDALLTLQTKAKAEKSLEYKYLLEEGDDDDFDEDIIHPGLRVERKVLLKKQHDYLLASASAAEEASRKQNKTARDEDKSPTKVAFNDNFAVPRAVSGGLTSSDDGAEINEGTLNIAK